MHHLYQTPAQSKCPRFSSVLSLVSILVFVCVLMNLTTKLKLCKKDVLRLYLGVSHFHLQHSLRGMFGQLWLKQ